jgi:hypothetical protein
MSGASGVFQRHHRHVCFGSKADMATSQRDVRPTPVEDIDRRIMRGSIGY